MRKTRQCVMSLIVIGAAVMMFLITGCAMQSQTRSDKDVLSELNERWAGARCRIRLDVPISKWKKTGGWPSSWYITQRTVYRKGNTNGILSVSDRDALPGGQVARGTAFIAEGWKYEDPGSGSGLYLMLRFEDSPLQAKMTFHGTFDIDLGRKDARALERWARMELFKLYPKDEVLVDTPAAVTPTPPVTPLHRVRETAAPQTPDTSAFELHILGVSVEPLRAAPGEEIGLVITYSVEGLPAGQTVDIEEHREIMHNGRTLTTTQAGIARKSGTYKSRQSLRIPSDLAQGIYELKVKVEGLGMVKEGSAIFQVQPPVQRRD